MMNGATHRVMANVLFKSAAVVEKKSKGVVRRVIDEAQPEAESRRTKGWPGRVLEHAAEAPLMKQGGVGRLAAALGGAGALAYLAKNRGTKDKAKAKVQKARARTSDRMSRFGLKI